MCAQRRVFSRELFGTTKTRPCNATGGHPNPRSRSMSTFRSPRSTCLAALSTLSSVNLVFLGSGSFGLPTLEALARSHRVTGVVTQPDRPAGRGGKLTPTPIGEWAAANLPGVPLLKPENINEPSVLAQVRAFQADAWVVIAFGQKLSPPLLADRFAINLHASLLPRWRGAAPINWAILGGDTETGNSVISLADRMDAGLVYGQSKRAIEPQQTAGELHDLLAADGPALVMRVLDEHARGIARGEKQDESRVTLARKLKREDATIDVRASADECRRRVHGLTPWPGVTMSLAGETIKLLRVGASDESHGAATGTLLDASRGTVACGRGVLQLLEIQPPGKRAMAWGDYARGRKFETGAKLAPNAGGAV